MLNLSFIFDDAIHALTSNASRLAVVPLPAAVYMMQVDVINHYRHALDHYFTLTLNESFLQSSSIGTPYQKWAYFTNKDFEMLSFAIHNLLRYSSRLIHETEVGPQHNAEDFSEMIRMGRKSNSYTNPICEIRFGKRSIGICVHEDNCLSIVAVGFKVNRDTEGNEHEQAIEKEEFDRLHSTIRAEKIDIGDRSILATLRQRGTTEIAGLVEKNRVFSEACNVFYQSRNVAQPFDNFNESWWT